jgi:flagellar biosynthetic protein FlhB
VAQADGDDRTLEASARKLEQARSDGDVPVSREGSAAGVNVAALIALLFTGGLSARRIREILLPMLDQPNAFLDATPLGWQAAVGDVVVALGLAIVPFFGLVFAGALLPHLLQNSITVATRRIAPKLSNVSPIAGFKRIFSLRALFEFAKALVKAGAVGVACFMAARPFYERSISLVPTDLAVLPQMLQEALLALLFATTLVALFIAGIDVPYQHWIHRRRMRMTFHEMKEEMRSTEGDPRTKLRQRKVRRQRSQRRMMHDVPKATVVVTNPTHFAVALKYERGKHVAPVVVAKGADLIALRIRQVAEQHDVAVVENAPLARALHGSVEIGDVIPQEHFEAVAKVIGLVWAQRARPPGSRAAGISVGAPRAAAATPR